MKSNPVSTLPGNNQTDSRQAILRAVDGIRYGSVEVTIHNGQIVQIESREKVRIHAASNAPKSE